MIPLKSILAGLGAAALAAVAMGLWMQGLQYGIAMSGMSSGSYYVAIHWHKGLIILSLLLVFALGFWWQFRRERRNK